MINCFHLPHFTCTNCRGKQPTYQITVDTDKVLKDMAKPHTQETHDYLKLIKFIGEVTERVKVLEAKVKVLVDDTYSDGEEDEDFNWKEELEETADQLSDLRSFFEVD